MILLRSEVTVELTEPLLLFVLVIMCFSENCFNIRAVAVTVSGMVLEKRDETFCYSNFRVHNDVVVA